MNEVRAANGLGWFSIGLGLTQVLAPRKLGRLIGVGHHPRIMRAMGVREILQGAFIPARPRPEAGLWARVAGDVLDLGLLASALGSRDARGGAHCRRRHGARRHRGGLPVRALRR